MVFTGIIEEIGCITAIQRLPLGVKFQIQTTQILDDAQIGQSICVNGCCLTITDLQSTQWTCDVVQETLKRTNLKYLKIGDRVNLERAVRYQDRLGGHLIQGHIDETGQILNKQVFSDGSSEIAIEASPSFLRYVIHKGSIAVDGISLTIADLQETHFSLAIIPHTAQKTTLGFKQSGDLVNLEADMIAKYVERLTNPFQRKIS